MPDRADMSRRRPNRRPCSRAFACLVVYAVFLTVTPFEHHDLSCEVKTPQHCIACTSTIVSADPDVPIASVACALVDVGHMTPIDVQAESLLLGTRTTGRSPPSRP